MLALLPFLFAALSCGIFDGDGDGFTGDAGDCDDGNSAINPSASDLLGDAIDQNCDGLDGTDLDGDGDPSEASGGTDCDDSDSAVEGFDQDGDGFSLCDDDCDDAEVEVYPDGSCVQGQVSSGCHDECNGRDDNCDGLIDEALDGVTLQTLEGGACYPTASNWETDYDSDLQILTVSFDFEDPDGDVDGGQVEIRWRWYGEDAQLTDGTAVYSIPLAPDLGTSGNVSFDIQLDDAEEPANAEYIDISWSLFDALGNQDPDS